MIVFCSTLISCFRGMLLRYFLSDIEMVPVAPIITGITVASTFYVRWLSIMRYLYFKILPASVFVTFLYPGIATYIDMHFPFLLSWNMMSGLLLLVVLSVRTCWFHNTVTLPSWLVSADFGTLSYRCLLSNFTLFHCICNNNIIIAGPSGRAV